LRAVLGDLIVAIRVHDDGCAIRVEQQRERVGGAAGGDGFQRSGATGGDLDVRQIAGMRAVRVLEAVFPAVRVQVSTVGGERGFPARVARAGLVDVHAVRAGGQARDL